MNKHYQPEHGQTSEEVKTEDGKHKYWRLAVPLPLFVRQRSWPRKVYICQCGKSFPSAAAYELHYRKAYEEEMAQTVVDARLEANQ